MGRRKKGKKRKKGKSSEARHTPLAGMKKKGSKLVGPMSELAFSHVSWDRDLLPEHLWIAALAHAYGVDGFHHEYGRFLDAIDELWPEDQKKVCLGLISDFALLPEEQRAAFLAAHRDLARRLFWDPIGEALSLYPECPARWLVDGLRDEADGSLDPTRALDRLRGLVRQLLGGQNEFATRVRVVPFGRPLKRGKMFFMESLPTLDLLPRYPVDLEEEERAQVESFVRASMMAMFGMREDLGERRWPRCFWRKNFDLAVCVPVDRSIPPGMVATDAPSLDELQARMESGAGQAREYVERLKHGVRIDLYDPRKDETLLGLFARLSRLFILLFEEPRLWARDVGSIILRCLADTAITFVYLASKGTDEDFKRFVEYGEGQQKLLMLQLQDHYPTERSAEGLSAQELEKEFAIMPEFIDIELGHWAKKDARKLAKECGMERLYRLVFTPASSDVHGNWLALRRSHLTFCEEPLHRYHRLPHVTEPPFFIAVAETAQALYQECREVAVRELGYPDTDPLPDLG